VDTFALFVNILPLYALVALGHVAAQHAGVDRRALAQLAIFFLVPVVIFGFLAQIDLRPEFALLPLVGFGLHASVALAFLAVGRWVYPDNRANLLALVAGSANSGYFGLPVVMALFDPYWVGAYTLILLGGIVYEATIMYYIAARGQCTVRQSLIKLARFPVLYAALAGLAWNLAAWPLPPLALEYWGHFKGAYVVIGMMIVGAALPRLDRLVWAPRFLALAFAGKFVAWPAAALALVALDRAGPALLPPEAHKLILVLSVLPPAANVAAFAAALDLRPDKAATVVLLGTLFALAYIPIMLWAMGV
jgi:malate permease and related proteins